MSLRVGADGRAYFHGLERCSSVHECPVCVVRIQAERVEELRELDRAHHAAGGGVAMATLTLPHDAGDALKVVRKVVTQSWQYCITGAPWHRWRDRAHVLGYVRAAEATHGPNGWHPHLHVVMYTARPLAADTLGAFERWLSDRWRKAIAKRTGRRLPSEAHGVKLEACRDASYIAKMGLSAELALSGTKEARPGHRTPWQILRDLTLTTAAEARRRDTKLWREWAGAMRGTRQLTWSRGAIALQSHYRLRHIRDDADVPDPQLELPGMPERQDPRPADRVVYEFSREQWRAIVNSPRSIQLRLELLEVAEARPPDEWADAVLRVVDKALGLEPVPF